MSRRILILAGEASGDHHAARVVEVLKRRDPGLTFIGLGGPELRSLGVELMAGLDDLAVMGFAEVVGRLGFFWRLERRVRRLLAGGTIDLVLAVDYPGFNLRAARAAHEAGVPVVYYIAPQVWAWKAHRARALARHADRIEVILPFEPPIFQAEGGAADFVGHPLVEAPVPTDDEVEAVREAVGAEPGRPVLALLPGSRRQELDRHLDLFCQAAAAVVAQRGEVRPVLAAAPGVPERRLAATGLPVTPATRALLRLAHAGIVKSGTSTLEAAVADLPFVMAYRTSALTYALARRLVRVPHIALANLVAGERVVPEFLQGEANPEALARAVTPLLDAGSSERAQMLRGLARVRERLGEPGAAERVADSVLRLLPGGVS